MSSPRRNDGLVARCDGRKRYYIPVVSHFRGQLDMARPMAMNKPWHSARAVVELSQACYDTVQGHQRASYTDRHITTLAGSEK